MRKLSKINESVWSDMHKRSTGNAVRKEDDVNNMDADKFLEYLTAKYHDLAEQNFIHSSVSKIINYHNISVEIIIGLEVSISYDDKGELNNILIDKFDNIYLETTVIAKEFNISKYDIYTFKITEKDGTISNKTFENLIDFIRDNMDIVSEITDESVWSDMHKRSTGKSIRMEDDIDHLNIDDFFDYLTNHYEYVGTADPRFYGPVKGCMTSSISFPCYQYIHSIYNALFELEGHGYSRMSLKPSKERFILIPYMRLNANEELDIFKKIREAYDTENVYDQIKFERIIKYINVKPKEGKKVTNTFCLEIIDFINDNLEEPLKKTFIKKSGID